MLPFLLRNTQSENLFSKIANNYVLKTFKHSVIQVQQLRQA